MKYLYVVIIFVLIFFYFFNYKKDNVRQNEEQKNTEIIIDYPAEVKDTILENIKNEYMLENGMVASKPNETTSESQSYGMLLAVYNDDKEIFDNIWKWTRDNLQVREDSLFAWLWKGGKVKDKNSATDADQDIAYALILAHRKWGDEKYLEEARNIINGIWSVDTKVVAEKRYITAGSWVLKEKDGIITNPSYLAPYIYREFAEIDKEHDWQSIVNSSYEILNLCSNKAGIAMDWCKIDKKGRLIKNFRLNKNKKSNNYSYDAMRTPFRVAMDYNLLNDERALQYLKLNNIFLDSWNSDRKIYAEYDYLGKNIGDGESLASYGIQLANFSVLDKDIADQIFEEKIKNIDFNESHSFYDLYWLWSGIHFYSGGFSDIK